MEIYRKKSIPGKIDLPIAKIKPTQFQLYLDRIFDPETQKGILGLINLIRKDHLILPSPKEDPPELVNRRKGRYFSDLIRLATLQKPTSIYAIAGTHRIVAILLAHWLYGTRNYLKAEEYDLANIKNLKEFNQWRTDEFVLQKVKGSNIGKHYRGFDLRKYQKGFHNQFTAKYGGKRIFVKIHIHSWEELIFQNALSLIKRLHSLLSQKSIKNQEEILIAKDIIHFLELNKASVSHYFTNPQSKFSA
jgi:hypothetical protein